MTQTSYTDKELLSRLFGYVRPYMKYVVVAIICMVFVSGLTALQAYLIKPILDKIFIEKNQFYFELLPFVIFAVFLLKGITYYFYQYYLERVGKSVVRDLRLQIFTHLQRQSLSFFNAHPSGELMSRLLIDVEMVQGGISSASVGIVKDGLQIIGLVGLIFYMDWQLAIFCFGFIMIAFLPVIFFSRIHRRLGTEMQQSMGRLTAMLHEAIQGSTIIKAFSMEKQETNRFAGVLGDVFRVGIRDIKTRKASHSIMELLGGIGIIAIIVYGGGRVMNGESSTGTFFSFLTALIMTYDPIKGITKVNSVVQQGLASLNRIYWLLDHPPEIMDKDDAVELTPFSSSVRFDNVWFQYPENEAPVIKGIDITIDKGQMIALVGHSGSGKSTLASLFLRFMDVNDGKVTMDGVDIRDVTMDSLRKNIAVVTQTTVLFDDTIGNNIAYGREGCSLEDIHEAARHANAMEFIEALPSGFDTMIGEAGVRLSGGQRQRLAIARAFVKNAPILILDEATSSLDTVSERAVQDAIDNLMEGRTVMVIAHRLTTVERADRIFVIKDGSAVESGTHEMLLSKEKSEYRKLYQLQQV
jgi:ATP-binding cassette, subfamily B, bacterial MsbA